MTRRSSRVCSVVASRTSMAPPPAAPNPSNPYLSMQRTISTAMGLAGRIRLPADKSIAHRAALLAALADGRSELIGFSEAADPQSTLACLRALGVETSEGEDSLIVHGLGGTFHPPSAPLDCGNSGTTMRLLAGVLAGQPFASTLTGDASLSARPMGRI